LRRRDLGNKRKENKETCKFDVVLAQKFNHHFSGQTGAICLMRKSYLAVWWNQAGRDKREKKRDKK
jgi:hypothetical protein